VIIIDEADYLNPNSTQPALRNAMEEYASNCSFIFTCNFKGRIIDPLHSRCAVVDFALKNGEKQKMAAAFFARVQSILKAETVDYDQKVLVEFVKKFFPDFRRIINELQRYSQFGKIDTGILSHLGDLDVTQIINFMKEKDFGALRKWVGSHDIDPTTLYRKLYDSMYESLKPESIPQTVLLLADYSYKQAFCADGEINIMACLTEIMMTSEFK
jgi:DNA polymerase III delta prime subunit